MPLIGQTIDICLYFTSLEQLSYAIDRSVHRYVLVFFRSWAIIWCRWSVRPLIFACILQVLSNYPMPLIGQTIDICLYLAIIEQLSRAIDRSDHWYLFVFYKYRSDHVYLLVFYKSWVTIRCHWSVGTSISACILQVLSNYPMPLIGQIIDICLHFTSPEQLSDNHSIDG